jgi:hypothetical protein
LSKGRLTRHELSWLLTQEAQNAAERLRVGVQVLRTQAPPPPSPGEDPTHGLETSLDALDDVMKMLSNLNQRATHPGAGAVPVTGRRGRIDIAALLVEVAPDARVSIEPGSGTEVYGDEADFRRMLQVLAGHGSGEGASVTVRRDGEEVRVSVVLGPDLSPTAETERAWLNRVVIRYSGRHELEGGSEALIFPADGAADRNESAALRKELDEARKQGEVYARELAAIFDRGEEITAASTMPPSSVAAAEVRFAAMTKICAGVASELQTVFGPMGKDVGSMRSHEVTEEQLETLRRRMAHAQAVMATLAAIGQVRPDELGTELDLVELARAAVRAVAPAADRDGVKTTVNGETGQVYIRRGAKAVAFLVRQLVAHAVEASPRGGVVDVSVGGGGAGARLIVDDSGSPLPASGRRTFLALETHAGTYGRPSGLPIFLAAELAACQAASVELSDAPSGGLRVTVVFAPAGPAGFAKS